MRHAEKKGDICWASLSVTVGPDDPVEDDVVRVGDEVDGSVAVSSYTGEARPFRFEVYNT